MTYSSPQVSPDLVSAITNSQRKLNQGFIALQSESHPIDFRRFLRLIKMNTQANAMPRLLNSWQWPNLQPRTRRQPSPLVGTNRITTAAVVIIVAGKPMSGY